MHERLRIDQALERAVEGRGTHREDGGPVLLRLSERDALLVLPHDPRQLGHEVRPAASLALPVADVPSQELDVGCTLL